MLSACVTGPRGYLKRSANNRLFDMFGFHGGKRQPVYNPKYIKQAKRNVRRGDIDYDDLDDYDDEGENISRDNISIYKAMIEDDYAHQDRRYSNRRYPSIRKAHSRVNQSHNHDNIRKELNQLKSMLHKTNEELASKKCPLAEAASSPMRKENVKPVVVEPLRSI